MKNSPILSMAQAGRRRSFKIAFHLGLSLFVVFSGVLFFQQFREKKLRIEQKLTIDDDFLIRALHFCRE